MVRQFVSIVLVTLCSNIVSSQALYTPRNVKAAYKNGTRSPDGKPGRNYWQNRARYTVNLTALPPDRNIKGTEQIVYINNSPDTLRSAILKLFLNIHKPGAPRGSSASSEYLNPGVSIDAASVNGQSQKLVVGQNTFTNKGIRFPKPLLPHDSVTISIDWHYQISLESNREGMIDSTTYFFAYFYPRIAVYDDANGWDLMNFTDDKEFYSDFNDYDVTINAPKNYIVWGTGTLQNVNSLLQPEFAKRFTQSLTADNTVRIVTREDLAAKKITSQNDINKWQFKATNIPDMAFGMSDHFVWDGGSVVVDDAAKRRASVQAVYNDTAKDYRRMIEYGQHALSWLSRNWPGIPYPYEKMTIFHGYAGMEYPMMANDETYEDSSFSRFVAEHEIAHTYMPFYMGINETRYGFMDEGWATTFEILISEVDLGLKKAAENYKGFRVNGWINNPSPDQDLPIITPGDVLTGSGMGNNEYGKASLGYLAMKDLLGDVLFKKCLHGYMERWHGKHPLPWDFFYSFNDVAKKDLNWFWNSWFFSNNYIDLAIKSVAKTGKTYNVVIQNIGGMPAPADLVVTYADGEIERLHQSTGNWEKNQNEITVKISPTKKIQSIELEGGIFMDADRSNNSWLEKIAYYDMAF